MATFTSIIELMSNVLGARFYVDALPVGVDSTIQWSAFDYLFAPLYSEFQRDYFLDDDCLCFRPSLSDEEFESLSSYYGRYVIHDFGDEMAPSVISCESLPVLGPLVEECEGTTVCIFKRDVPFAQARAALKDLAKYYLVPDLPRTYPDLVDALLHNWDGVYWQIFTRNETYLNKLVTTHARCSGLRGYSVRFEEEFPMPSEKELCPLG